jgi:hypothetical protein
MAFAVQLPGYCEHGLGLDQSHIITSNVTAGVPGRPVSPASHFPVKSADLRRHYGHSRTWEIGEAGRGTQRLRYLWQCHSPSH